MIEVVLRCDSCGEEVSIGLDESGDLSTDDFVTLTDDGWSIMGENALCPVCAAEAAVRELEVIEVEP